MLPSEDEIMQQWSTSSAVMVSICCSTYNHAEFVADTLNGFLLQKTNFRFEILIHDDVSTDDTREILDKYKERYPRLITLVYPTVNQYSQGKRILPKLYKIAKGDFISVCEGDDYWCSHSKINHDIEYLLNNSGCSLVFSPAMQIKNGVEQFIRNKYSTEYINKVDLNWVLFAGGGAFPTCSTTFRRAIITDMPMWFFLHPTGDYPLLIQARLRGKLGYINSVLTVYRDHDNSVSHQVQSGLEAQISIRKNFLKSVSFFNALHAESVISAKQYHSLLAKEVYILVRKDLAAKGISLMQSVTVVSAPFLIRMLLSTIKKVVLKRVI